MPKLIVVALKTIAIIFTPIAIIGLVITKQVVSGDQYVAALEVLGSESSPGAIEVFGADIQTLSAMLNFFQSWSVPVLITIFLLGFGGLILSKNRIRAMWQVGLGLFFSFGLWAAFFTRSRQAFIEIIGTEISDLSAAVIATYLAEISARLFRLSGSLALGFGAIAMILWLVEHRRKAHPAKALN